MASVKELSKGDGIMSKTKTYLVNLVLPNSGDSKSTKAYRETLGNLGYNRYQQAGSVGGTSVIAGTIVRK